MKTAPHIFTRAELACIYQDNLHNKQAKKLITIDNKVYDVTEFTKEHPGGENILLTQQGRDSSDVFHEMHPLSAYEILANYYVGDIEPEKTTAFSQEMRHLRTQLEKKGYFNASTSFYIYKVITTLLICLIGLMILKQWGITSSLAVYISAVLIGLFWQQCGWLAHDFAHYQVIKDTHINNIFLVIFGNLLQGFSLSWWKNKHNTHHASTNVTGEDPDIKTAPILIWDEFTAADFYGTLKQGGGNGFDRFMAQHVLPYQTRYYFFILAFARFSWAVKSFTFSFSNESKSKLLSLLERLFLIIHWIFFSYVTIAWISQWKDMILFFIISQSTAGYLLALVFAMNHNGMPVFTSEEASKMDFYELQVLTGRDVSSNFFGDWLMGGLNYQIEHHLFPQMPRHRLPSIKSTVKQICKKHHIHYHDTNLINGTIEVLKTLEKSFF